MGEGGVQEAMNSRELEKRFEACLGYVTFSGGVCKGQTPRPIWKLLQLDYDEYSSVRVNHWSDAQIH